MKFRRGITPLSPVSVSNHPGLFAVPPAPMRNRSRYVACNSRKIRCCAGGCKKTASFPRTAGEKSAWSRGSRRLRQNKETSSFHSPLKRFSDFFFCRFTIPVISISWKLFHIGLYQPLKDFFTCPFRIIIFKWNHLLFPSLSSPVRLLFHTVSKGTDLLSKP